tara:strand:+ start:870 stop:1268 length:399 start_codon:yes stop_codon:yes gene_type:complete
MTLTRYDILKATSEILEDNRTLDPDLRTSWNEASIYLDEILCALDSEGVGDDGIDTIVNIREREDHALALLNAGHLEADIETARADLKVLQEWDDDAVRAIRLVQAQARVDALVEKTGHYPQNVQHVFKDIT